MEVNSITEQLLFTTVRIETQNASGERGIATSFILNHRMDGKYYPFLVTNKHVVSEAKQGRLKFTQSSDGKLQLGTGYTLDIKDFDKIWIGHPSEKIDIAVTPFVTLLNHIESRGVNIFYRGIGSELVPSENELESLDTLEEVVFIGYPNGIWDSKNLLPIIRKGITATPVAIDFQGEKQFLIDASVFPGSSGSPVFLYNSGVYTLKKGGTVVGNRLSFLGVLGSVFFRQDLNEIQFMPSAAKHVPVAVSKEMIDLGIVFRSSLIIETINSFLKEKKS